MATLREETETGDTRAGDVHCNQPLCPDSYPGTLAAEGAAVKLQPIHTAPRDGRYILVFGDSGYTTTPLRCEVCRYHDSYMNRWRNHANDAFDDGGGTPSHWAPLPEASP